MVGFQLNISFGGMEKRQLFVVEANGQNTGRNLAAGTWNKIEPRRVNLMEASRQCGSNCGSSSLTFTNA